MLKLETPEVLYLLLLIPIFFVLHYFFLRSKKRKLKETASLRIQEVVMPDVSIGKQKLKFVLLNIVYALLVVAAANPQYGFVVNYFDRWLCALGVTVVASAVLRALSHGRIVLDGDCYGLCGV